jgi:hypothetical protein
LEKKTRFSTRPTGLGEQKNPAGMNAVFLPDDKHCLVGAELNSLRDVERKLFIVKVMDGITSCCPLI